MSKHYVSLEMGGVKRGLSFKVGVIRILKAEFGKDFYELMKDLSSISSITEHMPEILYAAAANNCNAAKREIDFTVDDAKQWVDQMDPEDLFKIIGVVLDSYVSPAAKTGSKEVSEKDEPFPVGGDRENMPGANDDASVGTGSIHVQRPVNEAVGV